jgi:hypothetical protein
VIRPESSRPESSRPRAGLPRLVRTLLPWAALLVLSLPLAAVTTIFLSPFWSWLESALGIEAFGHSGPADWCYAAAYVGLLIVLGGILRR